MTSTTDRSRAQRHVRVGPTIQPAVAIPWPAADERPAPDVGSAAPPRVLVAGVGYTNLRDFSVGPAFVERLRNADLPERVLVEDLSAGAIHVLHWLRSQPPFEAAVFVTGVERGDPPGSVRQYAWSAPSLPAEAIQERVAEAVTGVISLETLLTVLGYFAALPPRVVVVEVEPRDHAWGPDLSPPVLAALDEAEALVRDEVARVLAAGA